ncbi:hypothetical protein [Deinococcus ruber]|uniref:PepSY domain-containing protein n=1 Tax=Deinococcus ruber TaxID=1848197 RepID=A0A918F0H1_9DEIO|nr:hypothetical protein [Deinococcus ruber]GGQ96496.1 hypothetical protein GCM10008957_05940 [Deinococcus ruber]
MSRPFITRYVLLPVLLLALGSVVAQGQMPGPAATAPPAPLGGPPVRGGPPPPHGPPASPLGFDESRRYAARAAAVARQLQVGEVRLRPTPQGPRLALSLTYLGRPVTSVLLRSDLSFAELGGLPLLPDTAALPSITSADRSTLQQRIGALAVSGLAVATGPQVHVSLLSKGAAVADLRFDRASGVLLAEPPDRGRGGPKNDGPPRVLNSGRVGGAGETEKQ